MDAEMIALAKAFSTGSGQGAAVDDTLTQAGQAADAKAVGDRLSSLSEEMVNNSGWTANKYLGTDESGNVVELDAPSGGSSGDTEVSETIVGTTPYEVNKEGLYIRPELDTVVYNQSNVDNLIDQFQTVQTFDNVVYGAVSNNSIEVQSIVEGANVAVFAHIYGYAAEVGDYTLLVQSSANAFVKVLKRTNSSNISQSPATNLTSGYSNSIINFSVTEDDWATNPCYIGVQITNISSPALPDTYTIQLVKGKYDSMPESVALEFNVSAGQTFSLNPFNGLTAYSDPVTNVYEAVESESGEPNVTSGTLLCFGDSLTAMTEYPERITAMGMNAINLGVSATFMRYVSADNELYPYCLCRIVDCLKAGDLSTQIAGGKNANYSNLASLLDSADGIVLEYGTNDYNGDCQFSGDDTSSIEGALRYCLTELFTLYPRKEIYVVSTFMYSYAYGVQPENPNGTVADMNAVIKSVCEEFAVPFIDLLHNGCFNQITRDVLTGDGLHPNVDAGKERMAKIMYALLRAHGRV